MVELQALECTVGYGRVYAVISCINGYQRLIRVEMVQMNTQWGLQICVHGFRVVMLLRFKFETSNQIPKEIYSEKTGSCNLVWRSRRTIGQSMYFAKTADAPREKSVQRTLSKDIFVPVSKESLQCQQCRWIDSCSGYCADSSGSYSGCSTDGIWLKINTIVVVYRMITFM